MGFDLVVRILEHKLYRMPIRVSLAVKVVQNLYDAENGHVLDSRMIKLLVQIQRTQSKAHDLRNRCTSLSCFLEFFTKLPP